MTQDAVPAAKREEWRQWARNEFGENERAVEVATKSVLEALVAGYSVNDAMGIACAAAAGQSPSLRVIAQATRSDSQTGTEQRPVSDRGHLRGLVSSFRQRNELMQKQYGVVWDFRVDSWDGEGRAQPSVAVEMRGLRFTGSVGDGDWVEIRGQWKPGEVLSVSSVRNISQNSIVTAHGGGLRSPLLSRLGVLIQTVLFLIILGIFALAAYKMLVAYKMFGA